MSKSRIFRTSLFLPSSGGTSTPLLWVIAVMMFLLTLVLSAAFAVFNATARWTSDLTTEFTVQIAVQDRESRDRQVAAALDALNETPGVIAAEALNESDLAALLEPWIGSGNVTADLPVPALISARLASENRVDMQALTARIVAVAPDARVDDHQGWLGELAKLATTIESVAVISIALMLLATTAIVVFGSRARLIAHWDIIEIVHLMGANDQTISREFRARFMRYGLTGGIFGLAGALLIVGPAHFMAGITGFEILPSFRLSPWQVGVLTLVPVISAILSMVTANMTVRRSLAKML